MHPNSPPLDILIRDVLQHFSDGHSGTDSFQVPTENLAENLAENHPLKQQALLVMDAVESVTNGMENPEVFDRLCDITPESPFLPWVNFISALRAFYRGDTEEMVRELEKIPAGSPPKALSNALRRLSSLDTGEGPIKGIEKQLIESVGNPGGPLFDTLLQISEAREKNREDIFSDSVAYLSKELYGTMPDLSKRLYLWALSALKEKGWEDEILCAHGRLIFGFPESERLRSLSLFDTSPDAALFHWARFRDSVAAGDSGRPGTDIEALDTIEKYLTDRTRGKSETPESVRKKRRTEKRPVQLELFV